MRTRTPSCADCPGGDDVRMTRTICAHEHVDEVPLCPSCRDEIDSGETLCGPCWSRMPHHHDCRLNYRLVAA